MNETPFQLFESTCGSILSLIRCADIYGIHAISLFLGESPGLPLIRLIIKEKGVSPNTHSWQWSVRIEEYDKFERSYFSLSISCLDRFQGQLERLALVWP